jgi:hypothetical protein
MACLAILMQPILLLGPMDSRSSSSLMRRTHAPVTTTSWHSVLVAWLVEPIPCQWLDSARYVVASEIGHRAAAGIAMIACTVTHRQYEERSMPSPLLWVGLWRLMDI